MQKKYNPQGLEENKKIAQEGGEVAKVAKDNLESKLKKPVVNKNNNLSYKYVENKKITHENK